MKRKIFLFASLFVIPLLIISCSETSREDERLGETGMENENVFWPSDRDYVFEEKNQFEQDVNEGISKLDDEIQNLQQEADLSTEQTKQMYNERISELKTYRDNLNSKIKDIAAVTEENWEDFKTEITSVWNDVENSYDQMAREIEDNKDKVY
jgi:uncharacterized coiled-coil DUF342 family protein